MKKILIASAVILAAFVLLANYTPAKELNPYAEYQAYAKKYGKTLSSDLELVYRAKIYENFVEEMNKHNADKTKTWKMGINQFSDMTK